MFALLFDVEVSFCVVGARGTSPCQSLPQPSQSDGSIAISNILCDGYRAVFAFRCRFFLGDRRKGSCTVSEVRNMLGFCSVSKNEGRRGTCEEDLQRCMSRGGRNICDTCISEMLGGPGAAFRRGLHFGASDLQVV